MTSSIFCPLCMRKNRVDATHCAFCGIQFTPDRVEPPTTHRVSKASPALTDVSSRCAEQLLTLPDDALALFVMDETEPFIIEDISQVILGRQMRSAPMPLVDLTKYGGIELGVSRNHVQITRLNDVYTVVDLGSTNGSWLNGRRLPPGKPYRLRSSDTILLGQLKISVCFHSTETLDEVIFYLKDDKLLDSQSPLHPLTPEYMATTISPYLQALAEMQRISEEFRHNSSAEVRINAISIDDREARIIVRLRGATESVQLTQKWVTPWREAHLDVTGNNSSEIGTALQDKLNQLASKIVTSIAAEHSSEHVNAYSKKLVRPLMLLATGGLTLSRETN